jgi:hypothetical protein
LDDSKDFAENLARDVAREQGLSEMNLMQINQRIKALEDLTKAQGNKIEKGKFNTQIEA